MTQLPPGAGLVLSFCIPSCSRARKQAAKLSSFLALRGWGLLSTQGLLSQALGARCSCVLIGAQSFSQKGLTILSRNVERWWVLCKAAAEFVHPLCLIC